MVNRRRPRRRAKSKTRRHYGMGLKDVLAAGVKLGRDKRYKRMGALGARGHYKRHPRPWAV